MHLTDPTLNELLDGLSSASAEAHLASCAECAARLSELRQVSAVLAALPDEAPGRDLSGGVVAAIRRAQATAPPPRPAVPAGLRWALALQGLAAAIALATALPFALGRLPDASILAAWLGLPPAEILDPMGASGLSLTSIVAASEQLTFYVSRFTIHITRFPMTITLTDSLPLATVGWIALMAALTFVWVAGNGLLLGTARGAGTRTRSNPWIK